MTGTAFDETLNFNYNLKNIEGADQPLSFLEDFLEVQINNLKDECTWDEGTARGKQIDNVKFACSKGIREAHKSMIPPVEPVAVQHPLTEKIGDTGLNFVGFIDLLDQTPQGLTVVDNKVTWGVWRSPKQWQHLIYSYLLRQGGVTTDLARYDIIQLRKRADPEIIRVSDVITPAKLKFVQMKIDFALSFLKYAGYREERYNHNTSSFMCGTFCPHVDDCEKRLGIALR